MTRIRFEHLTNKVELKLDPIRTALLGAGIEDWDTTDELSELIELVRKEIYPPPAPQVASNAPPAPQVASNPAVGGKEQSLLATSTTGQQTPAVKPAENTPKTLEKVPTLLAGRVSDAVWTTLNSDERRELELYFVINAMWVESGYMRGRVSVQEAGRKVSVDASRPLAVEVYNAYKSNHDPKTLDKLFVDHNVNPQKVRAWLATNAGTLQATSNSTPVEVVRKDATNPQGLILNTNLPNPSNSPNGQPTNTEKLPLKNENGAVEVGLQTLMAFAPLDMFMKTLNVDLNPAM